VILLLAVAVGLLVGLGWAHWQKQPYWVPEFRYLWLVAVAFLPQFLVIYLPITRRIFSDSTVVVLLFVSQVIFLEFVWLNRRIFGMPIVLFGMVLNLMVMTTNGGFMPISHQTASRLVPEEVLQDHQTGSRLGPKDILLRPQDTRFEQLADRFLPPAWFPYQVAFSLGDVFIALGVFLLLAKPGPILIIQAPKRGIPI
jgi:hypothetical protein